MPDILNYRLVDSENPKVTGSLAFYFPLGMFTFDQLQVWATAHAPIVDAVTGAKIDSIDATMQLVLPGGLKANPVAASLNERGGLISLTTDGDYPDSVRIPAILTSIMADSSFIVGAGADAAITNFITWLTATQTAGLVKPVTRVANDAWLVPIAGKKSFRKQ